jgi:hypothetical protein
VEGGRGEAPTHEAAEPAVDFSTCVTCHCLTRS